MATVDLMYHELESPGRALCQEGPGYARYVLKTTEFREHLEIIRRLGLHGCALIDDVMNTSSAKPRIVLTFDDGCETDLIFAAPLLREFGFTATFFVVAGFLGRPGYMTATQVQELASLGMEIGCHSMTHAYLSDLDEAGLRREIVDAKLALEQVLGTVVRTYSCPGGRWTPRAAALAKEVGFLAMGTSRIGVNTSTTDPFHRTRLAVTRDISSEQFTRLCQGRGLWRRQWADRLLGTAKSLLGNHRYEKLRALVLNRRENRS